MVDIKGLKRRIEEHKERTRDKRIAAGLPAERPYIGGSEELKFGLYSRLLPFKRIAVKYLQIKLAGGKPNIDTSKLVQYREMTQILMSIKMREPKSPANTLLHFNIGRFAASCGAVLDMMEDPEDKRRNLTFVVNSFRRDVSVGKFDDSAFEEEYAQARADYNEIKHLI